MTVQDLVALIDPSSHPKDGKTRAIVHCPGHEDKTPSLSVWIDGKDKAALNCFAGCNQDQILAGLPAEDARLIEATWRTSRADFRPPPELSKKRNPASTPPSGMKPEAVYTYTDEHGNPQYEVHRHPGKQIRQFHREDEKLIPGRGHTSLYPYRLPDVLKAIDVGETVFVVEGEKDADTLASHGLTATTNVDGAGKWKPEYNTWFEGADVVILPDNDHPGHDHANSVATMLTGHGSSIRVVELPGLSDKGDVTDWLETNTIEDLDDIVNESPFYASASPTSGIFGTIYERSQLADLKPPKTIFGAYLVSGGVNMLYGPWGSAKSFLVIDWGAHLATGTAWNGHEIEQPETVLFWAAEGQGGLHGRLTAWETHNNLQIPDKRLLVPEKSPKLDHQATFEALARLIEETEATHLFIDTLIRVKGDLSEDSADDIGGYLLTELAQQICTAYGCTTTIVHHIGYNEKARPRGSSSITDNVDGLYSIKGAGLGTRIVEVKKLKDQPLNTPPDHFDLLPVEQSAVLVPTTGVIDLTATQTNVLKTLEAKSPNGEWVTKQVLAAAAGVHENTVRTALSTFVGTRVDYKVGKGTRSQYRLPPQPNATQPTLDESLGA